MKRIKLESLSSFATPDSIFLYQMYGGLLSSQTNDTSSLDDSSQSNDTSNIGDTSDNTDSSHSYDTSSTND